MIVLNQGDPPACLTVNSRARKSAVLKSALIDLQGFDTALKSRGRHARLDGGSRWATILALSAREPRRSFVEATLLCADWRVGGCHPHHVAACTGRLQHCGP